MPQALDPKLAVRELAASLRAITHAAVADAASDPKGSDAPAAFRARVDAAWHRHLSVTHLGVTEALLAAGLKAARADPAAFLESVVARGRKRGRPSR